MLPKFQLTNESTRTKFPLRSNLPGVAGVIGIDKMSGSEQLCLIFIPALISVLLKAEKQKGAPLTEEEVVKIRDSSTCMAVKISDALKMEDKRGYPDIVAEDVWNEWQAARRELV